MNLSVKAKERGEAISNRGVIRRCQKFDSCNPRHLFGPIGVPRHCLPEIHRVSQEEGEMVLNVDAEVVSLRNRQGCEFRSRKEEVPWKDKFVLE